MRKDLIDDIGPGAMQILKTLELMGDGVVDTVPSSVKSVNLFTGAAGLTHLLTMGCHCLQFQQLLFAFFFKASRRMQ